MTVGNRNKYHIYVWLTLGVSVMTIVYSIARLLGVSIPAMAAWTAFISSAMGIIILVLSILTETAARKLNVSYKKKVLYWTFEIISLLAIIIDF